MKKNFKLKKKYQVIIVNVLMVIFLVISLLYGYKYFKNQKDDDVNQKQIELLKSEVKISEEKPSSDENILKIDINKLKDINEDVVGWLKIPNTNIDYPILQGNDNEYYLNRNIYKEYNRNGSIYLDANNDEYFNDNNSIIYGHNMNTREMFSDLVNIYEKKIDKVDIYLYLENKILIYSVYSSYITTPNDAVPLNFYQNFFEDKVNFSNYEKQKNKTLTLSTCNNTGKKRIIVHAVLSKIIDI